MQPIVQSIADCAAAFPERPALMKAGTRVSYGELWSQVVSAAHHLRTCGVQPGDRVLLAGISAPAFVYGYFGTHLLGAVAVPFDPQGHADRRDELAGRTRARCIFHAAAGSGSRSVEEFGALKPSSDALPAPGLAADADLLFTTGSTGRPKGVRLTQLNIATSARHINAVIVTPNAAVEVLPLPLYHAFGLGRLRCNLLAGRSVVLTDGFRLPGEIFAAIENHGACGLVGVPAGFAVLLGFGARGLGRYADQLRYIEIGSAPMPVEHKRKLMDFLPRTDLWMHYGLTEAARSAFIEFHRHHDRLDSVGLAAPGVDLSIRSPGGATQDPREPGMLWIGGKHISPGYWDDPEFSRETFADGWARTGDVASLDDRGFIKLHGRSDDMIKVGGFNVSPDEVEGVLAKHPAVSEAACIGIADPRDIAGQVVCAYIVAPSVAPADRAALAAELSQWVSQRLEPYKVPARYDWLGHLPRTESGKLLRKNLRIAAAS